MTSIKDSLGGSGYAGQGLTTYSYDPALRLTTIAQSFGGSAGPIVLDSYNPDGTVSEMQRETALSGNRTLVNTSYTYDANDDMTGISNFKTVITGGIHSNQPLSSGGGGTYNSSGQSTAVSYDGGSSTNTYTYDPAGQLINSGEGFAATYSYDLNGNRNSTGYTTGAGNELTNSPGVTYTYDNDGNMITATTSSGTTTYTYDYENRLTNVEVNGTMVATYTYDALGRRIGIEDNGTQTWTVFNGTSADANPYADFNGSGSVTVRYLFGPAVNQILARTSASGTIAWYMTDQLGSVTDIMSTSGTDLDQITYDPYGNIVSQTGSSYADRFMFAGMQYDTATGLYYDHARYYNAATGRFTSQDPLGGVADGSNSYRYVLNSPTVLEDSSGLKIGWHPVRPPTGWHPLEPDPILPPLLPIPIPIPDPPPEDLPPFLPFPIEIPELPPDDPPPLEPPKPPPPDPGDPPPLEPPKPPPPDPHDPPPLEPPKPG